MYSRIYGRLAKSGRAKSAVILYGPHAGTRCMVSDKGEIVCDQPEMDWRPYLPEILETEETKVIRVSGQEILVELFWDHPRIVLLGGGHVALKTAALAKMLGFHITVMDDREAFASESRFADADERICGAYSRIPEIIPVYENAYYVVATHGHEGDAECVRQLLKRPCQYLGMIGSRRKVALTWEMLRKEGFSQEQLDFVHAPIGLPIGGKTPEEIAVSILAEIIQVKNAVYRPQTDPQVAAAVLGRGRGVMMTIVKKSGSSPRGVGSKMFYAQTGESYGSIGGGKVEYEALRHAPCVERAEVCRYDLFEGGNTGMLCGGRVEVLFERLF